MHKKLLVFVFTFNLCQAAEQADAKAEAASEIEKKVDKSLAQELNEREKKELLAAQNILFRLKGKNAVDGTDIGPGLPEEIGAIICDEFVGEWNQEPTCVTTNPWFGNVCAKIRPDNHGIIYSHDNSIIVRNDNGQVKLDYAGEKFEISSNVAAPLLATFVAERLFANSTSFNKTPILIWNLENFKNKQTLSVSSSIRKIRFMSDASKLVAAPWFDKRIELWDIETGSKSAAYGEDGLIGAIAVSPDKNCVVSGSHEANDRPNAYTIKIFDVRSGQVARELVTASDVTDLHFLPGDHELVSSELSQSGNIYRWDVGTGKKIMTYGHSSATQLPLTQATQLALTKDGTRMVSAGTIRFNPKNYAYVWNVQTGALLQKLDMGQVSEIGACDISSDGLRVLAAGEHIIKVWKKVDMKKELWQAHGAAVLRNKKI